MYLNGQLLCTNMITADKIYLAAMPEVQVGMSVVQHKGTGRLTELFEAFAEQWNRRWSKHQNVGLDQWQTIVDFASRHFRPIVASPLQHTKELFRATVAAKKKSSARGLDGVDRSDLLHLDDVSTESILAMYQRAHRTGDWPAQVLKGSVASLAKVSSPETVSDFRPITVFSLTYRAWSSMESRHWLRKLDCILADWLCGNRQACRAMTLWREIVDQVENAYLGHGHRHGLVFDLEKAFNTVPRLPVMALAKLSGLPHDLLVAWSGALNGMERHFKIRQSHSPALTASCGVPEGCGLSCLAMLLIDQAFHLWLSKLGAWVTPMSYVDNWEAIITNPDQIATVFRETLRFAESLDLSIDSRKTHAWSTCPTTRRMLRTSDFVVKHHCRDLGAHVVYSKQIANSTTLLRLQELDDFWTKLSALKASYSQKMRLIKTVAWPRAFHAISAVVLGRKRFQSVRAKAMQAIGLDKAGANGHVQLVLDSAFADPQSFTLLETIRDFRDLGADSDQLDRLIRIGIGLDHSPYNTVNQILCQRLHQVGMTVLSDGFVVDDFGKWNLAESDFGEVKFRLQQAWLKVVNSHVQHRVDFQGFGGVDLQATRCDVETRPPIEQGVLRRCLNGTTNTLDVVCHWSDNGAHLCPECGSSDSLHHRLWECPFVNDLRSCINADILHHITAAPSCCRLRGWTMVPHTYQAWHQKLNDLPMTIPPAA